MRIVMYAFIILTWLYTMWVLTKAKVNAARFFIGSSGVFLFGLIFLKPYITKFINYALTAVVGIGGDVSGCYKTLFSESAVYVQTSIGGVLLQIDVECSGVIEILAFLSILLFFDIYSKQEKLMYGVLGTAYIIAANALRVVLITMLVYAFGYDIYYVAHAYIGRILFYLLSVALYFWTFTKPQIKAMRVGRFHYSKGAGV